MQAQSIHSHSHVPLVRPQWAAHCRYHGANPLDAPTEVHELFELELDQYDYEMGLFLEHNEEPLFAMAA